MERPVRGVGGATPSLSRSILNTGSTSDNWLIPTENFIQKVSCVLWPASDLLNQWIRIFFFCLSSIFSLALTLIFFFPPEITLLSLYLLTFRNYTLNIETDYFILLFSFIQEAWYQKVNLGGKVQPNHQFHITSGSCYFLLLRVYTLP